jgi:hypothetical protein
MCGCVRGMTNKSNLTLDMTGQLNFSELIDFIKAFLK